MSYGQMRGASKSPLREPPSFTPKVSSSALSRLNVPSARGLKQGVGVGSRVTPEDTAEAAMTAITSSAIKGTNTNRKPRTYATTSLSIGIGERIAQCQ